MFLGLEVQQGSSGFLLKLKANKLSNRILKLNVYLSNQVMFLIKYQLSLKVVCLTLFQRLISFAKILQIMKITHYSHKKQNQNQNQHLRFLMNKIIYFNNCVLEQNFIILYLYFLQNCHSNGNQKFYGISLICFNNYHICNFIISNSHKFCQSILKYLIQVHQLRSQINVNRLIYRLLF
ncbi:unnamed protein product [Paramecium sonneborni]|uniref:Uncharacterized protein n=1 Tax=Paramecium sonneborni TaxID=65129 RepID=A0A8S1Q009_9CILI|nr:unnamed protein product [Paramecium sonneborni]